MQAILLSNDWNPHRSCESANNGRTDDTYFYSSKTTYKGESRFYVTVSNCYYEMTAEKQREELEWFLEGKNFIIIE